MLVLRWPSSASAGQSWGRGRWEESGRRLEQGRRRAPWGEVAQVLAVRPDPNPVSRLCGPDLGHSRVLGRVPAKPQEQIQGAHSTQLGLTQEQGEAFLLRRGELQHSPKVYQDAAQACWPASSCAS